MILLFSLSSWDALYEEEIETYDETGSIKDSSVVWFEMSSVRLAVNWIVEQKYDPAIPYVILFEHAYSILLFVSHLFLP